MNAKLISRFISLLYHLACLGGLVLQVTEISINFLKYETVSSINIKMPGVEEAKAINVCFRSDQVFNHSRYVNIVNRMIEESGMKFLQPYNPVYKFILMNSMFTIADKLNMSYDFDDLIEPLGPQRCGNYSIKFLYLYYICYHKFGNCEKDDAEPYTGCSKMRGHISIEIYSKTISNIKKVKIGFFIV